MTSNISIVCPNWASSLGLKVLAMRILLCRSGQSCRRDISAAGRLSCSKLAASLATCRQYGNFPLRASPMIPITGHLCLVLTRTGGPRFPELEEEAGFRRTFRCPRATTTSSSSLYPPQPNNLTPQQVIHDSQYQVTGRIWTNAQPTNVFYRLNLGTSTANPLLAPLEQPAGSHR